MRAPRWTFGLLAWALLGATGCTVSVRGSALSNRGDTGRGIYLSTGGSPRPFRTLGFVQVTGYGVNVGGIADVGDAALDGTVKGALAQAAHQMGGEGVINIEFLDTNPPTPADRLQSASRSLQSFGQGQGRVETKDRVVIVSGEVISFTGR
jgi:hypothetical protein